MAESRNLYMHSQPKQLVGSTVTLPMAAAGSTQRTAEQHILMVLQKLLIETVVHVQFEDGRACCFLPCCTSSPSKAWRTSVSQQPGMSFIGHRQLKKLEVLRRAGRYRWRPGGTGAAGRAGMEIPPACITIHNSEAHAR